MTKTYKTLLNLLSIHIYVNGKLNRIDFAKDHFGNGVLGASYTTSDKDVQKAIESNERFNKKGKGSIWTDDVEPEEPKQKEIVSTEPAPIKRGRKPKAE